MIGRVARQAAILDQAAEGLWIQLVGRKSLARHAAPRMVAQVLQACREMLEAPSIDPRLQAAGLHAIRGAEAANTERNRVVHDIWLHPVDKNGGPTIVKQFAARGGKVRERTMSDLEHAERALIDARQQIVILTGALQPGADPGWIDALESRQQHST